MPLSREEDSGGSAETRIPGTSRPGLFALTAALLLAALIAGCGGDDPEPSIGGAEAGDVTLLFVQTAAGASLTDDGARLELDGISAATTVFTDRPERKTFSAGTSLFVAAFDAAFDDDPPNAAVSVAPPNAGEYVVTLDDPELDGDSLSYAVVPLEGAEPLPSKLGPVSIFIDPAPAAGDAIALATRLLQRIRELEVELENSPPNSGERQARQEEVTQLSNELQRICANVEFDGQRGC